MKIEIREAKIEDTYQIAKIYVDGCREEYSSFIPLENLQSLSYEKKERDYREWMFDIEEPPLVLVSIVNNEIVGFIYASKNEDESLNFDTEINNVFVRKEFQNKGVGIKLLYEALNIFKKKGHSSVVIWAFKEGKSVNFYKHIGGKVIRELTQRISEKDIPVIVFGWEMDGLLKVLMIKLHNQL